LDNFTFATGLLAELGFLGFSIYTFKQTPDLKGEPSNLGVEDLNFLVIRAFLQY